MTARRGVVSDEHQPGFPPGPWQGVTGKTLRIRCEGKKLQPHLIARVSSPEDRECRGIKVVDRVETGGSFRRKYRDVVGEPADERSVRSSGTDLVVGALRKSHAVQEHEEVRPLLADRGGDPGDRRWVLEIFCPGLPLCPPLFCAPVPQRNYAGITACLAKSRMQILAPGVHLSTLVYDRDPASQISLIQLSRVSSSHDSKSICYPMGGGLRRPPKSGQRFPLRTCPF